MPWLDIMEIRRTNLRLIAEAHGTSEVCKRLQISKQRLSALIGIAPSRDIGIDLARRIEAAFGIEKNWLDNMHPQRPSLLDLLFNYAQSSHPDRFPVVARVIEDLIQDLHARTAALASPMKQSENVSLDERPPAGSRARAGTGEDRSKTAARPSSSRPPPRKAKKGQDGTNPPLPAKPIRRGHSR